MKNEPAFDIQKEKKAQFIWTSIIVGFFLIQAILWAVAVTITASDKSHAIIENYDQLALNWQQQKELRLASEQLGWNARIEVAEKGDIRKNFPITITLSDKNRQPVTGAVIALRAFHRARAAEPQAVAFKEAEPGTYVATLRLERNGLWQFDGRATIGSTVYLIDQKITLRAGK